MGVKPNKRGPGFVASCKVGKERLREVCSSVAEGEKKIAEFRRRLKGGGDASLPPLSGIQLADYHKAREALNGFDRALTLHEAVLKFVEKARLVKVPIRLDEAVVEFLAAKKGKRGKDSWQYRNLKNRVGKLPMAFKGKLVSEVSAEDLRKWVMAKYDSPVSIRNWLGDCLNFFNFGYRKGWCEEMVMNFDEVPDVVPGVIDILTVEEMRAVMSSLWNEKDGDLRKYFPHFFLQAFAGIRDAESKRLTWGMFNFKEKCLVLPDVVRVVDEEGVKGRRKVKRVTKTRDSWVIRDFEEGLFDCLEKYRGKDEEKIPFPSNSVATRLRSRWVDGGLVKGVPNDRQPIPGKASRDIVFPHNALRHSFATYSFAVHKNWSRVAQLTRHTKEETLRTHYMKHQLAQESGAEYFGVMLELLGKKETPAN